MLGCGLASLTALVLRFRRVHGIERQQLKWLLFACAVTITIVLVVQPGTSSQWDLGLLLAVPFFPALPVAAGIAILRYRLYEIDRNINRTPGLWAAHRHLGPMLCRRITAVRAGRRRRRRPTELAGGCRHPGRGRGLPARP